MAYIEVNVGSDIVYVAGTVNGVETVWQEINGKWYGYADASEDNLYEIWLEMYDAAGNRSEYSDSIYYEFPYFVTDRTAEDVENRTAKGFLNAKDLNRIEKNNLTIADLIAAVVSSKTDWAVGGLPRVNDFERILSAVTKIRSYARRSTTPPVPEHPINHYQKVNDIEQIQKDCFELYVNNKKNVIYAGEVYAGEGGFL